MHLVNTNTTESLPCPVVSGSSVESKIRLQLQGLSLLYEQIQAFFKGIETRSDFFLALILWPCFLVEGGLSALYIVDISTHSIRPIGTTIESVCNHLPNRYNSLIYGSAPAINII